MLFVDIYFTTKDVSVTHEQISPHTDWMRSSDHIFWPALFAWPYPLCVCVCVWLSRFPLPYPMRYCFISLSCRCKELHVSLKKIINRFKIWHWSKRRKGGSRQKMNRKEKKGVLRLSMDSSSSGHLQILYNKGRGLNTILCLVTAL